MVRRRRTSIVLPTTQLGSQGWGVQWRRGNAYRDTYEVIHRGHLEGGVVVTGEGWKWYAPNRRGHRYAIRYSTETFPTWQEAVTALAKRFRRTDRGRSEGAKLPAEWINVTRPRRNPWTPRPIHDDFATYFAQKEEGSKR